MMGVAVAVLAAAVMEVARVVVSVSVAVPYALIFLLIN